MDNNAPNSQDEQMQRREITLEDGRYMIFYTFGSAKEEQGLLPQSGYENTDRCGRTTNR